MHSPVGVRAACIDIGSNTTRLLVADCVEGQLREVHQERAFTRIGQGLRGSGAIAGRRSTRSSPSCGARWRWPVSTARTRSAVWPPRPSAIASNGTALVEAIAAGTGPGGGDRVRGGGGAAGLPGRGGDARRRDRGAPGRLGDAGHPRRDRRRRRLVGGRGRQRARTASAGGRRCRWARGRSPSTACTPIRPRRRSSRRRARRCPRRWRGWRRRARRRRWPSAGAPRRWDASPGPCSTPARSSGPSRSSATRRRPSWPSGSSSTPSAPGCSRPGLLILQGASRLLEATVHVGRGGIREGVLLEALQA